MLNGSDPTMLVGADGPESLVGRRIARRLRCCNCTYDLRGLEALGVCPECGVPVRQSILRNIDPEVHAMPQVDRPVIVAAGVRWFFCAMMVSFLLWICSWVLGQLMIEWNDMEPTRSGAWPQYVRDAVNVGNLLLQIAMFAALASLVGLWCMRSLVTSKVPGRSLRILIQLALGTIFWLAALLLHEAQPPGGDLGVMAREMTSIGGRGTWLVEPFLVALSPLVGGWVLLLGLRSFFGEMGRRSREFRTATTKRQKVLDVLWASLFWCMGEVLQLVGAANGLPTLVTFGTVVRVISGLLVVIGLVYLLMNLLWISGSLASPPPKLRVLLSPPRESKGDT